MKREAIIVVLLCISLFSTNTRVSGESMMLPSAILIKSSLTRIYTIQGSTIIEERALPPIELLDNTGVVVELSSSIELIVDIKGIDNILFSRIVIEPDQKQVLNLTSWVDRKSVLRASLLIYPRSEDARIIATLTLFQTVFNEGTQSDTSRIKIPVIENEKAAEETSFAIIMPKSTQDIYINLDISPLPKALIIKGTIVNRSVDGAYRTSIARGEFLVRIRILGHPTKIDVSGTIVLRERLDPTQKWTDTVFASLLSIMLFVAPLAIRHTALKKAEARRIRAARRKDKRGV